jgi:hypothetical protein
MFHPFRFLSVSLDPTLVGLAIPLLEFILIGIVHWLAWNQQRARFYLIWQWSQFPLLSDISTILPSEDAHIFVLFGSHCHLNVGMLELICFLSLGYWIRRSFPAPLQSSTKPFPSFLLIFLVIQRLVAGSFVWIAISRLHPLRLQFHGWILPSILVN